MTTEADRTPGMKGYNKSSKSFVAKVGVLNELYSTVFKKK
jgi:hypothetical protein